MRHHLGMSAIATAILVRRSDLERVATGSDHGAVEQARTIGDYRWSGYVLATLLPYLEEHRNIDLMKSEFDALSTRLSKERHATHFILTDSHTRWLADLDAEKFSEVELRDYFNEFNESNEDGVGRAMLDGIRFIRGALAEIDAESAVILRIG
jgi:hypothetical protein